jgi:hypothetical protein
MKITLKMLRDWGACSEGYKWVSKRYKKGVEYVDLVDALNADNHRDWAMWIVEHVYTELLKISEFVDADFARSVASCEWYLENGDESIRYARAAAQRSPKLDVTLATTWDSGLRCIEWMVLQP